MESTVKKVSSRLPDHGTGTEYKKGGRESDVTHDIQVVVAKKCALQSA
jgi:hypothetical protein